MNARLLGGMGWERDIPDVRDRHQKTPDVQEILAKSKRLKSAKAKSSKFVDLRKWCSPIEDQGNLGSCTANAGAALFEYFQNRAFGKYLDGSRLFLYKTTRNLLGWDGDQGAYLRTTMKSMVLFGIPPESYWEYSIGRFDDEPTSFLYSLAQNYQALAYYRLDPPGTKAADVLASIKEKLDAGLPSMFGFSVYSTIPGINEGTGDIPFPTQTDKSEGGHAIVAVGYDDSKQIKGSKGALLIRNSWGTLWGENGYGWLPYEYVLQGLAVDFWSLISADFVNTDLFE